MGEIKNKEVCLKANLESPNTRGSRFSSLFHVTTRNIVFAI